MLFDVKLFNGKLDLMLAIYTSVLISWRSRLVGSMCVA
jgi:hypothetical protein